MANRSKHHLKYPSEQTDAFGDVEEGRLQIFSAFGTPPSIASSYNTRGSSIFSIGTLLNVAEQSSAHLDHSRSHESRRSALKGSSPSSRSLSLSKGSSVRGTARLLIIFLLTLNLVVCVAGIRWLGGDHPPGKGVSAGHGGATDTDEGEASFERFDASYVKDPLQSPYLPNASLLPANLGYLVVPGLTDPAVVAAAMFEEMKRIGQPEEDERTEGIAGNQPEQVLGGEKLKSLLFPIGKVRAFIEGSSSKPSIEDQRLKIDIVYTFVDPYTKSFRRAVRARKSRANGNKITVPPIMKVDPEVGPTAQIATALEPASGLVAPSTAAMSTPAPTPDPRVQLVPMPFCAHPYSGNSPQASAGRKLWDILTPALAVRNNDADEGLTNPMLKALAARLQNAQVTARALERSITTEENTIFSAAPIASTSPPTSTTTTITTTTSQAQDEVDDVHEPIEDMNRYRDFNEFLHSLRGVYYNLMGGRQASEGVSKPGDVSAEDSSTIGNIYIVVADKDQVPGWLSQEIPEGADPQKAFYKRKIVVIEHADIFPSPLETLPTFNSFAIESQIYRIPNLSRHYLYFNNDMLLARPVSFFDYFQPFVVYPTQQSEQGTQPVVRWLPTIMPDSVQPVVCARGTSGSNCKANSDELLDRQVAMMREAFKNKNAVPDKSFYGYQDIPTSIGSSVHLYYSHLPTLIDKQLMQELMEGFEMGGQHRQQDLSPTSISKDMKEADVPNVESNVGATQIASSSSLAIIAQSVKDMLYGIGPVIQDSSNDYISNKYRRNRNHYRGNGNDDQQTTTTKPAPRRVRFTDGKRHGNADVFPAMLYVHYSLAHRFGRDYRKAAVATGGGGSGMGSVSGKILSEMFAANIAHVSRKRGGGHHVEATRPDTGEDDHAASSMNNLHFPPSLVKKLDTKDSYGKTTTFIDGWGRERTTVFGYITRVMREEQAKWRGQQASLSGQDSDATKVGATPTVVSNLSAPSAMILQTLVRLTKDLHMVTTPEGKAVLSEEQFQQREREESKHLADRRHAGVQRRQSSFNVNPNSKGKSNGPPGSYEMPIPIHFFADTSSTAAEATQQFGTMDIFAWNGRMMTLALTSQVVNLSASRGSLDSPFKIKGSPALFSPYHSGGDSTEVTNSDDATLPANSAKSFSFPSRSIPVWRTLNREGSYDHWLVDYFTMLSANVFPQSSSLRYYFGMAKGGRSQSAKIVNDVMPRRGKVLFLTINDDIPEPSNSIERGGSHNNNYNQRVNRMDLEKAYAEARANKATGFVGVNRDRIDQMIRERAENQAIRSGRRGKAKSQAEADSYAVNDNSENDIGQLNTNEALTKRILAVMPFHAALFLATGGQGGSVISPSMSPPNTVHFNESSALEYLTRQILGLGVIESENHVNNNTSYSASADGRYGEELKPDQMFSSQLWMCVPQHIQELAIAIFNNNQRTPAEGFNDARLKNVFSNKVRRLLSVVAIDFEAAKLEQRISHLETQLKDLLAVGYRKRMQKEDMTKMSIETEPMQQPSKLAVAPAVTVVQPKRMIRMAIPEGGADLIRIYEMFAPKSPAAWEISSI